MMVRGRLPRGSSGSLPSRGAPDELVQFIRDQYPRVEGALALFVADPIRAQDLAQEAFVRVCERWDQVSAMEAPGPWVHRVAMNLAISGFRRSAAEQRAGDRLARGIGLEESSAAHETRCSVVADVAAALQRLDTAHRAVVVLRFFADLSVRGTAEALRIPEGTVKTRTRHALTALRDAGVLTEVTVDE